MRAALFPDAIQPLLDLHSLTSITLELFNVGLSLAVSDVDVMAKSWPHLARFSFGGSISTPTLPEVTILIAFAELFPALKELTLHLDVTIVPSGNSIPILSHGLQKLQIGCYDIPKPVLLAQFIDSIFPYIATDSSPWLAGSWEKVLGFVQQFQLNVGLHATTFTLAVEICVARHI
ncbi:hypothetical protein A0H81_13398 [Grifola frondosa]|uniref:Uncharacterized protein n=1 Tax=Grifola frondosa TaxID=5627 RepID=A0A1C7LRD2_GRIFR|nr:hypothetical protein A0H81_13398 [Grifola frondosa]